MLTEGTREQPGTIVYGQRDRCLNCGHHISLHWTLNLRCRRADDCLCRAWMSVWPKAWPAIRPGREPGPDAYDEYADLIDGVRELTGG